MELGDRVLSSFSALAGEPSWVSRTKLGKFEGRVSTIQNKAVIEDCDFLSRTKSYPSRSHFFCALFFIHSLEADLFSWSLELHLAGLEQVGQNLSFQQELARA
jgi:hypothetical protein